MWGIAPKYEVSLGETHAQYRNLFTVGYPTVKKN